MGGSHTGHPSATMGGIALNCSVCRSVRPLVSASQLCIAVAAPALFVPVEAITAFLFKFFLFFILFYNNNLIYKDV